MKLEAYQIDRPRNDAGQTLPARASIMNLIPKKSVLFFAALLSATAISMPPASAASNLMEMMFGARQDEALPDGPSRPAAHKAGRAAPRDAAPRRSLFGSRSKPVQQDWVEEEPVRRAPVKRAAAPAKRVTVTAPTNYDYRPEALVQIDFSKVDPQITASAQANTSSMPSMEMDRFGLKMDQLKAAHVRAEKEIADAIVSYYATKQHPIWTASYDVTPKAKAVVALFARAAEDGLDPEDYAVTVPSDDYDRADIPARLKELAEFELSLSARAVRYAMDQGEGRINPNRLSGFYDFPQGRIKPREVIDQLASAGDPSAVLAGFEPQNKYYTELKQNLHDIADDAAPTVTIAPGTFIRPGDTNPEIKNVVALIQAKAPQDYLDKHAAVLQEHAIAETYDKSLVDAIKDFQKMQGRKADGIIGNSTLKTLQTDTNASKRAKILYSMERLRWMPRDFGSRYVFINQPAYRAYYFNDNTEKLAMNIVIGSPTNQTYFFNDTIETVVFNPSWGIPRSIILNEMMPKILKNPSYLEKSGYEVYDKSGRVVPSSSVNWSQVASNGKGVAIRQKPSLDNALGELKILFPNVHDIYMHDTPAKSYFKREMRALSHGCMRLEHPRDMAAAVLGVPVEDLKQYFGKKERSVKVPSQLPVYVSYFTAWPDSATGKIHYYDDVYERDSYMEKAFVKTSAVRQSSLQTAKL